MSDMRSFIKVEHSRFTLILRKGILPFHWIAESHVYPDKGYVTAVRERTNYGAVWALSSRGALDQVMLSIRSCSRSGRTSNGWTKGWTDACASSETTKPNRRRQPMSDYKQRMIREHRELQERISKLAHMLEGYAEGTLDFTPACSFQLLESQLYAMGTYANILQERARIEQVDLNAPLEGGESGEVPQD